MTTRQAIFSVLVVLWGVLILYSSTNAAERTCNQALARCQELLFGPDLSPDTGEPDSHFVLKKAVHMTLFLVFAFLLTQALEGNRRQIVLMTLLAGGLTGCLSELLQNFFPGREPTVRDALINLTSTGIGALLFSRSGQVLELFTSPKEAQ